MNWQNKYTAFFYRNLIFTKRNIFSFAEILFWPSVSLLSVGLMGDFLKLEELTLSFILTGAITSGTIQVAQLDVSYSLLYDVWSKSVKHTFIAPIKEYQIMMGSWFVGIMRGTVVFILLTVFAHWAFGFNMPPIIPVCIYLCGIFSCALVIGMCVCFLVLTFGQRVEVTAWSFAVLLMLISGIYYPIHQLPAPFNTIAQLIPITYFLEYIRAFHRFEPVLSYPLIKGFALTIVYFFIFCALIRMAHHRARVTGMIVRLSE